MIHKIKLWTTLKTMLEFLIKITIFCLLPCFVLAADLSVLTYNVWFQRASADVRIPKILNIVHEKQPDIIACQEVEPWLLDYIRSDGRFDAYHQVMEQTGFFGNVSSGLLILSKQVPKQISYHPLPSSMSRALLSIEMTIQTQKLCIYTTHLDSLLDSTKTRVKQIKSIEKIDNCDNSLLLGDFNFGENDPENTVLLNQYTDVWALLMPNRNGYTWDIEKSVIAKHNAFSGEKSRRLDRIVFKGDQLRPSEIEIIGDDAFITAYGMVYYPSDHFGLFATFEMDK